LTEAASMLAENRRRLDARQVTLFGQPLPDLQRQAREQVQAAACAHFEETGEPVPARTSGPILMAGHQPELFHPGVWVKNFALNGLAAKHGLVPINLVVDNDTLKTSSLRLPARNGAGTHLVSVPFDAWEGEAPFEERPVHDETMFRSFAARAAPYLEAWGLSALLPSFWAEVCAQGQRTPLIGERFVAARRTFERRWGCHNLEIPLSLVCQTEAFARFACDLLGDLPRFHAVYNELVHRYRREHGIKSKNHPVPDLVSDGDWLEAPFWAWRPEQSQRGRLMARTAGGRLQLRAGTEMWPDFPAGEAAVSAWRQMESGGYKLRSRALTTTLFARLFLSDLFIHGIGGGKYDALTDDLIQQFYGVTPPAFVILTATLLLPLPTHTATIDQRRGLYREVRDLRYNPQRHLSPEVAASPEVRPLVARKADLLRQEPSDSAGRKQRFRDIRAATESLVPLVRDREAAAELRLVKCDHDLTENAVMQRRDFPFCLFPEEKLRSFCSQFLGKA
jgi:hypothetical protein